METPALATFLQPPTTDQRLPSDLSSADESGPDGSGAFEGMLQGFLGAGGVQANTPTAGQTGAIENSQASGANTPGAVEGIPSPALRTEVTASTGAAIVQTQPSTSRVMLGAAALVIGGETTRAEKILPSSLQARSILDQVTQLPSGSIEGALPNLRAPGGIDLSAFGTLWEYSPTGMSGGVPNEEFQALPVNQDSLTEANAGSQDAAQIASSKTGAKTGSIAEQNLPLRMPGIETSALLREPIPTEAGPERAQRGQTAQATGRDDAWHPSGIVEDILSSPIVLTDPEKESSYPSVRDANGTMPGVEGEQQTVGTGEVDGDLSTASEQATFRTKATHLLRAVAQLFHGEKESVARNTPGQPGEVRASAAGTNDHLPAATTSEASPGNGAEAVGLKEEVTTLRTESLEALGVPSADEDRDAPSPHGVKTDEPQETANGTRPVTRSVEHQPTSTTDKMHEHVVPEKSGPGSQANGVTKGNGTSANRLTTAELLAQLPPAVEKSIMDQVMKEVALQVRGGVSEMRIRLDPPTLGEVIVNVRMENGNMQANIDVSQASVKAALESNLPQLRQALAERGIDVQRLDIAFDRHSERHEGGSSQERRKGTGSRRQDVVDGIEQYQTGRLLGYNTIEVVI